MHLCLSQVNRMPPSLAAKTYAAVFGLRVFPLQPGSAIPFPGSRGVHDATDDLDVIDAWWAQRPGANIGLAAGDHYDFVDLDEKKGAQGWLSWVKIGGTSDHAMQTTPNNGRHVLIPRMDWLDLNNFSLKGEHGGIDVRTRGGYVVGAPSATPNGQYQWTDGPLAAPSPETCAALTRFSVPRLEYGTAALPEPESLYDFEVQAWLSTLPDQERNWLLHGVNWRPDGDTSKAAWQSAVAMAKRGWTLSRIARIGPETTLATFGAEPPHSAPDPWAWAWRYTVSNAWATVQEDRPALQFAPVAAVNPLEVLRQRVASLEPGAADVHTRAGDILSEAWLLGLSDAEAENLRQTLHRTVPEITAAWVKQRWGQLVSDSLQRRNEGSGDVFILDQGHILLEASETLVKKESYLTWKAREFGGNRGKAEEFFLTGATAQCECVTSLTYLPGSPPGITENRLSTRVYNTYRPSELAPAAGDVTPWIAMLDSLELEGEDARKALLNYMAWLLRYPGTKINHGVLLGGAHGAGKDSLWEPVMRALGRHNTVSVRGDELTGDFTSYLAKCKLLSVQEVEFGDWADAKRISAKLKPFLAAPPDRLRVNEKGIREYEIDNLVQVVAYTNNRERPVHMDPGERRWLAIWCDTAVPAPGEPGRDELDERFTRYYEWLDNGGTAAVYAHLLARDLSQFNPQAPPMRTNWVLDIQDHGRHPVANWIIDQVAARSGLFSLDRARLSDIRNAVIGGQQIGELPPATIPDQLLTRILSEIGARQVRGRDGRFWVLRKGPDRGSRYWQSMFAAIDAKGVQTALAMKGADRLRLYARKESGLPIQLNPSAR